MQAPTTSQKGGGLYPATPAAKRVEASPMKPPKNVAFYDQQRVLGTYMYYFYPGPHEITIHLGDCCNFWKEIPVIIFFKCEKRRKFRNFYLVPQKAEYYKAELAKM